MKNPPFTNSPGMKFVPIADRLGNPLVDGLVSVWMVRRRDYQEYADTEQNVDDSWRHATGAPGPGPNHPAVNISWKDAFSLLSWLTTLERSKGIIRANDRYSLLTAKEWDK